jgi:hypothetical protein
MRVRPRLYAGPKTDRHEFHCVCECSLESHDCGAYFALCAIVYVSNYVSGIGTNHQPNIARYIVLHAVA